MLRRDRAPQGPVEVRPLLLPCSASFPLVEGVVARVVARAQRAALFRWARVVVRPRPSPLIQRLGCLYSIAMFFAGVVYLIFATLGVGRRGRASADVPISHMPTADPPARAPAPRRFSPSFSRRSRPRGRRYEASGDQAGTRIALFATRIRIRVSPLLQRTHLVRCRFRPAMLGLRARAIALRVGRAALTIARPAASPSRRAATIRAGGDRPCLGTGRERGRPDRQKRVVRRVRVGLPSRSPCRSRSS